MGQNRDSCAFVLQKIKSAERQVQLFDAIRPSFPVVLAEAGIENNKQSHDQDKRIHQGKTRTMGLQAFQESNSTPRGSSERKRGICIGHAISPQRALSPDLITNGTKLT